MAELCGTVEAQFNESSLSITDSLSIIVEHGLTDDLEMSYNCRRDALAVLRDVRNFEFRLIVTVPAE